MSRLQRLPGAQRYIVTLNAPDAVAPDTVIARMSYEHPVYDAWLIACKTDAPGA